MNNLNENLALSIAFANTKRKKRELDLISIAEAFDYLVNLYGSLDIVANKIGISNEMVRKFLLPLNFTDEIKQLIQMRYIDSIDIISEISTIKDKEIQLSICRDLKNLTSKDVRDIIRKLKESNLSVEDTKNLILKHKNKNIHLFIIDFNDDEYKMIIKNSNFYNIDPAIYIKNIVKNELKNKFDEDFNAN